MPLACVVSRLSVLAALARVESRERDAGALPQSKSPPRSSRSAPPSGSGTDHVSSRTRSRTGAADTTEAQADANPPERGRLPWVGEMVASASQLAVSFFHEVLGVLKHLLPSRAGWDFGARSRRSR